jgi:hypothetical protein
LQDLRVPPLTLSLSDRLVTTPATTMAKNHTCQAGTKTDTHINKAFMKFSISLSGDRDKKKSLNCQMTLQFYFNISSNALVVVVTSFAIFIGNSPPKFGQGLFEKKICFMSKETSNKKSSCKF